MNEKQLLMPMAEPWDYILGKKKRAAIKPPPIKPDTT
jgi:hypothetical protein